MADIDRLIKLLARLPGLGPRSARRAALSLLKKRESLMEPLAQALATAASSIKACSRCGNLDDIDPCLICQDEKRDHSLICIVEDVADLWALERTGSYKALDGVGPEDLNIGTLVDRVGAGGVGEVILATNVTVDGQTTAHYITDRLASSGVKITRLAHGVPVGGELEYLDDGTLMTALKARH